jgi:hypothetical protein
VRPSPQAPARPSPSRAADHRSARSWLVEDDFADAQPAAETAREPRGPRAARGTRVRADPGGRPAEPAGRSRPDDVDLPDATDPPDDTRLAAEELPWGVPARAAAGDGPLPPAELVPRGHDPLRVALVLLGCCAVALVLLILLVLTPD